MTTIHLLIPSDAKKPPITISGNGWQVACDPTRKYDFVPSGDQATGEIKACNCDRCIEAATQPQRNAATKSQIESKSVIEGIISETGGVDSGIYT